jgi:hypothetical protein
VDVREESKRECSVACRTREGREREQERVGVREESKRAACLKVLETTAKFEIDRRDV